MKSTDKKHENEILENKIKAAVEHASEGDFEDLLERCDNLKGVIPMENKKRNNTKKYVSIAAAFVILVAAIFGITSLAKPETKSVSLVSLDVNPSVMLEVDEDNTVDDVIAVNEDGEALLADLKLKGKSIEEALKIIVDAMIESGYIDELANSVLVSVDDENAERATELEKQLIDELDKLLNSAIDSASVVGQVVEEDDAIAELAEKYGISKGKAEYIASIIEKNPDLTFEELAELTINEIQVLLSSDKVAVPEKLDCKGEASKKAYVDADAALSTALAEVGATKDEVTDIDINFNCRRGGHRHDYKGHKNQGPMLIEVEFTFNGYEYEIDIDAKSGEVVDVEKELADADDDDRFDEKVTKPQGTDDPNSGTSNEAVTLPIYPDRDDDNDDDDDKHTSNHHSKNHIGNDKALEKALEKAGLSKDQISEIEIELDDDDAQPNYEVEFKCNGHEYNVNIDSQNGNVLNFSKEKG